MLSDSTSAARRFEESINSCGGLCYKLWVLLIARQPLPNLPCPPTARGPNLLHSNPRGDWVTVTAMPHRAPMLIGVVCLFSCAALGDDDPRVALPIRSRTPVTRPDFRMESDLVLIPVSVTDSRNHVVTGLSREAFRVFDDRAEQTVIQFAREEA